MLLPVGFLPFFERLPIPPAAAASGLAAATALGAWLTRRDERVWFIIVGSMLLTSLLLGAPTR